MDGEVSLEKLTECLKDPGKMQKMFDAVSLKKRVEAEFSKTNNDLAMFSSLDFDGTG